jgi:hypothetical protein
MLIFEKLSVFSEDIRQRKVMPTLKNLESLLYFAEQYIGKFLTGNARSYTREE